MPHRMMLKEMKEGGNFFAGGRGRGEFRPGQTRQLLRAVDLKGRLLSCQSY